MRWLTVGLVALAVAAGGSWQASASVFPDPSLFGTPTLVPGISSYTVSGVTLTPDGQTMVFNGLSGTWRMFTAQWNAPTSTWGNIQQLTFPGWYNQHPSLSPNGEWLFYTVSGSGTADGLYRAQKQGGTWANPLKIPIAATTDAGNANPVFDGSTLYFARSSLGSAGQQYEVYKAAYDPLANTAGVPVLADYLNSDFPTQQTVPHQVVGGGNEMLLARWPGGGRDIWIATRNPADGTWGDLADPNWPIKSAADEVAAWYSDATRTLYFARNERLYQSQAAVPEPCTLIVWSLLGASRVTLGWWRRRKRAGRMPRPGKCRVADAGA